MNQQLLFPFLIIIYILSLVLCIVSASVSKKLDIKIIKTVVALHVVLILASLFFYLALHSKSTATVFFSLFFCVGIVLFGMISRREFKLPFKIYFGVFVLSFPVFVFSPSIVLSLLSLGELKKDFNSKIPLGNSYFLEKQQSMYVNNDTQLRYKVIKRIGYFNKTIARDLYFSGLTIDSARLIKISDEVGVTVRGYFLIDRLVDSADVYAQHQKNTRETLIQIKKNNKQ